MQGTLAAAAAILFTSASAAGKSITIPIHKRPLNKPVTRSQKLLTDYHHKYLLEKYESMVQLLGPTYKIEQE